MLLTLRNYERFGEIYKLILHRKDKKTCYVIDMPNTDYESLKMLTYKELK